jgi:hypothetical protein
MDILSNYISFGDKFIRFKPDNPYGSINFINMGKLSDDAIESLNNLEHFIRSGCLYNSIIALGLYSYIADREEFEEYFFEGFISLENYEDCHLYEYYYNKFDNIKIYVYDCSRYNIKSLTYINKNKCLFL